MLMCKAKAIGSFTELLHCNVEFVKCAVGGCAKSCKSRFQLFLCSADLLAPDNMYLKKCFWNWEFLTISRNSNYPLMKITKFTNNLDFWNFFIKWGHFILMFCSH